MDALNPAAPCNYKLSAYGYRCRDCGAEEEIGVAVRHSSRCDIAPKMFVLPSDQKRNDRLPRFRKANDEAAAGERKRAKSLAAAAREGTARLHFTDAEIAYGVRTGEISESAAMNQDF